DRIIDEKLTLEIADPHTAHNLLQPGYYVCFRNPVENSRRLQINNRLRVYNDDGVTEFEECSYAIFEVKRALEVDRKQEIADEVKRLLRGLDGSSDSAQASIDFVRAIMDSAGKFSK